MTIYAIIEKGTDGLYSIRTEEMIGTFRPGGYGKNVEEAKEDFYTCIDEAIEEQKGLGLTRSDIEVEFHYDLQSFFNYFDVINASSLARYVGINESQMRQYKNGIAYPNEKTLGKILEGVKRLGTELSAVAL